MMAEKLVLGTVQFGMAYGIANTTGRPNQQAVADILAVARGAGVNMLDTAIAYGDSEVVLGQVGVVGWKLVTKLPPVPPDTPDITGWMEAQIAASLTRLGLTQLYAVLLHSPDQMHGPRAEAIARALDSLAAQGLAARVGVSIQHPDHDLPAVLRHMKPGLVQSPFNLLDQALVTQGWADRLSAIGCEIHTRSAFLQGLLLMDAANRSAWFDRWAGHWQIWQAWLDQTGLRAPDACLRYALSQPALDCCVVGVDSAAQLQDLLAAGDTPLPSLPDWPRATEIGSQDIDLITPSRWTLT
jgi:aryl-alcohol dehydrogenase-like predicted oxidoreductase